MVEIGSLVSSLPDYPLPVTTVEGLEDHEAIVVSEPVLTDDTIDGEIVTRFALVTSTVGVVLDHVPDEGWTVIEKVDGGGESPKDLVLALSVESIKSGIESQERSDPL